MLSPLTLFKCLAEETRLKSVMLIWQHNELCVCDLQTVLQTSQPKVSRHLAELRKCQILIDERRDKWVYYRIHPALPNWARIIIHEVSENNAAFLASCRNSMSALTADCCE